MAARSRAALSTRTPPIRTRWTRSDASRGSKAFCRRSNRRTRVAHATVLARDLGPDALILVNLSGRGDKDLATVEKARL